MHYDALRAKGDYVFLFNCKVDDSEFVKCGLAYFHFRLLQPVELYDLKDNYVTTIQPPEVVQNAITNVVLSDPLDQVLISKV